MRKIILISLLAAFLFQAISGLVILAAFHLNRDYISKNLCVNRFDAIPVCKGACYLEKQLSDNEQRQQDEPELKWKEIALFCDNRKVDIENPAIIASAYLVFPVLQNSTLLQGALSSILKPPISIG